MDGTVGYLIHIPGGRILALLLHMVSRDEKTADDEKQHLPCTKKQMVLKFFYPGRKEPQVNSVGKGSWGMK